MKIFLLILAFSTFFIAKSNWQSYQSQKIYSLTLAFCEVYDEEYMKYHPELVIDKYNCINNAREAHNWSLYKTYIFGTIAVASFVLFVGSIMADRKKVEKNMPH